MYDHSVKQSFLISELGFCFVVICDISSLSIVFVCFLTLFMMGFPMHIDAVSVGLHIVYFNGSWERSGSVVACLTRDRRAAGSSLTGVTALWSLSKTHLS